MSPPPPQSPPQSPPPQQKQILILGGGIIGTSTAYFLTRHPRYNPLSHSITLIEATGIASGASGKAGGLLATWAYPEPLARLSFRLHGELAREHGGEEKWGYRGVECGEIKIRGRGEEEGDGDEVVDHDDRGGVHHEPLPKSTSSTKPKLHKSPKPIPEVLIPDDLDWIHRSNVTEYSQMSTPRDTAQVDPYEFTTSMANLAVERGVKIIMGTVKGINYGSDEVVESVTYLPQRTHQTGQEKEEEGPGNAAPENANDDNDEQRIITIPSTHLILTMGPWTKTLLPTCPITSARAHSVVLHPSRPISGHVLFSQISIPTPYPATSTSSNKRSEKSKRKKPPQPATTIVTPEIYPRPNGTIYTCGPTQSETEIPLPSSTADVNAGLDTSRCEDLITQMASVSNVMRDAEVVRKGVCYLPTVDGIGVGGGEGPILGRVGSERGKKKSSMKVERKGAFGGNEDEGNGEGKGKAEGGVFVGTGHTCWGINNGPGSGWVLARCVFGLGKGEEGEGEEEIMKGLEECEAWRYGL